MESFEQKTAGESLPPAGVRRARYSHSRLKELASLRVVSLQPPPLPSSSHDPLRNPHYPPPCTVATVLQRLLLLVGTTLFAPCHVSPLQISPSPADSGEPRVANDHSAAVTDWVNIYDTATLMF